MKDSNLLNVNLLRERVIGVIGVILGIVLIIVFRHKFIDLIGKGNLLLFGLLIAWTISSFAYKITLIAGLRHTSFSITIGSIAFVAILALIGAIVAMTTIVENTRISFAVYDVVFLLLFFGFTSIDFFMSLIEF